MTRFVHSPLASVGAFTPKAFEQAKTEKSALSDEIKRLKESEAVRRGSSDKLDATNRCGGGCWG